MKDQKDALQLKSTSNSPSLLAAVATAAAGAAITALTIYQSKLEKERMGEAIAALRESVGLTAEELWESTNIDPSRYVAIEASRSAPAPVELRMILAAILTAYDERWERTASREQK